MSHLDQTFSGFCSYKCHVCVDVHGWDAVLKQHNKRSTDWLQLKGKNFLCMLPWAGFWELLPQKVCVFRQMAGQPLAT